MKNTTFKKIAIASCISMAALSGFAKNLVPTSGRLLVVGQDLHSIADYVNAGNQAPGGVTAYIDMALNGLNSATDSGAGTNNVSELASMYPQSALVVAVYAVDQLDLINAGHFDDNISTLITRLKSFNRPVYLRFGYEFDGTWNHYEPEAFKKAWKRVHDKITELGAQDNIAMVWQSSTYCGSSGSVDTHQGQNFTSWWPGQDQVELVAVSYFTPGARSANMGGTCNNANEAIDQVSNFARSQGKPLMIAESTPQGYAVGALTWRSITGSTDGMGPVSASQIMQWYTGYFDWIEQNNVAVVAYINANWDAQPMWAAPYTAGYWGDSRVQANAQIQSLWTTKTASFLKGSAGLFGSLGGPSSGAPATGTGGNTGAGTGTTGGAAGTGATTSPVVVPGLPANPTNPTKPILDPAGTDVFGGTSANPIIEIFKAAPPNSLPVPVPTPPPIQTAPTPSTPIAAAPIPTNPVNQPQTLVIRARGTSGSEVVTLRINNQDIKTWTLGTTMTSTTITTSLKGEMTLAFINDSWGRDVQVDSIAINNQTRNANSQTINTGEWKNGSCGGGTGNSEWMHCNGYIGFGSI